MQAGMYVDQPVRQQQQPSSAVATFGLLAALLLPMQPILVCMGNSKAEAKQRQQQSRGRNRNVYGNK